MRQTNSNYLHRGIIGRYYYTSTHGARHLGVDISRTIKMKSENIVMEGNLVKNEKERKIENIAQRVG
jgi:hypothetical protein